MKSKFLSICIIFLVSACSSTPAQPTLTHLVIPTSIRQPTATLQPTETHQPTPTYLPITPVAQGIPLPEHGSSITVENIDRLTLLSRWGNGNPNDVIYTPDGKYFVIGTNMGLYFYNAKDYSLVHFIKTQTAISNVTISPDSQMIAAVLADQVVLYQISDWQLILSMKVYAISADFSPDRKVIALSVSADPTYLELRDAKTGQVLEAFKNSQGASAVKISPRGDVIATGGYSTTIWSIDDGSILEQYGPYISGGHTASVSFSPDGELLAEAADYLLRIWRVLENGRLVIFRKINLSQFDSESVFKVVISPNGKMVAATLSTGVGVWDLSTGQRVFYSASEHGYTFYNSLAWSSDSNTIAIASTETGVQLWDVKTEKSITTSLNTISGTFSSLAWSPNGQKLAAGAEEGSAFVFDSRNGNVIKTLDRGHGLNSLAFSSDSQTIALGSNGRIVKIFNLDGTLLHSLEGSGYGSSDATFSSDGLFFAATSSVDWQAPPQVRFWNTKDWGVEKIFPVGDREDYMITGFVLAPDQTTGAISYVDMHQYYDTDYIKIISTEKGTTLSTLKPESKKYRVFIDATAYSPNSSMLAALVGEFDDPNPRILVWQTSDWSLIYEKQIIAGRRAGWVTNEQDALAWSPDSHLLAIGVQDGNIQILRSIDGEKLTTFRGHTMWVTGVAFSPDGRILASLSIDGTLILWGLR